MPLDVKLKKPPSSAVHHSRHHADPALDSAADNGPDLEKGQGQQQRASMGTFSPSNWLSPRGSAAKEGFGVVGGVLGLKRSSSFSSVQGLMNKATGHSLGSRREKEDRGGRRGRARPLHAIVRSPEETAKALEARGCQFASRPFFSGCVCVYNSAWQPGRPTSPLATHAPPPSTHKINRRCWTPPWTCARPRTLAWTPPPSASRSSRP